ncbi:MAG TPA: ATP-binding protein [Mucilaginibacter sp.]|jgi:signal transduction histidine kinase|nr:ATP-binding protein [Mucilaginibacter sp.]
MKTKAKRFLLSRLSIKQRLPLLICTLLLACIVFYGFANYYSLKKADLTIGRDRLHSVTTQMNTSFGQVTGLFESKSIAVSKQTSVIQFLKSGGKVSQTEARRAFNKLETDSTWAWAELLDSNFKPLTSIGKRDITARLNLKQIITTANPKPDSARVTGLYRVNGGAYFALISAVTENGNLLGYAIAWKSILATPGDVDRFSKLVGMNSRLFIGNKDGSMWTDFTRPIPGAPFKPGQKPGLVDYINADGNAMIGDIEPIAHTGWLFGVAVSEKDMLNDLQSFVDWIVVIGIVILATGIIAAWIMSRNITRPLDELMTVATAIAQGNYSRTVPIDQYKDDEIGRLAKAFNAMIGQVSLSHRELESRVEERTLQLASVNKELEAFSYSVSHDLRTPLRAINGYSIMLKEDYESELDSEGKRIVKNIINNAKMMGQLIDDLLSFSRMGKKELVRTPIDMQFLAETVVRELLQHEPENKYQINIAVLPPATGDEVMIKQVMVNLVGNAIKYSSKKEDPLVEIGATDEETKISYYIRDNGAGFDMAYSSKLFGVFQRLHSQEDFEGSGVGLALVKRIIEKHNGEVWAEGSEGTGATFYFSIPKYK